MAKLERITGKVFGETASPTDDPTLGPEIGQFGSALAGTYVGTSDVATIQSLSAWSNGFIDAVTPTNQYPPLPEMTGFGKVLSYQSAYLLQEGVPEYDANTTYYLNSICKGINANDSLVLYRSIKDDNLGNPLSDEASWEELAFGGGGSSPRNLGEIVTSTIPLTDAGLHLLDGSLLEYGLYKDFIDYVAGIYESGNYSNLFTTESSWQSVATNYGVCGKFVYNSTNKTLRLPKIAGFLQGTGNLNEASNLILAGLPNITGYVNSSSGAPEQAFGEAAQSRTQVSGAMSAIFANTKPTADGSTATSSHVVGISFDASKSNSIYGKSSTVQPQSIKVLYYIVVATTTKTPTQINIDEIVTDLNNKADIDLSNAVPSASFKQMVINWGEPDYANKITISSLPYTLPSDGFISFGLHKAQAGTHSIYRNGVVIGSQYNSNANFYTCFTGLYKFKKGDVISAQSAWVISSLFFYPIKATT